MKQITIDDETDILLTSLVEWLNENGRAPEIDESLMITSALVYYAWRKYPKRLEALTNMVKYAH